MLRGSRAHTATLGVAKPPPPPELPPSTAAAAKRLAALSVGGPPPEEDPWEVRPGGMLVQRRDEASGAPPAPIRVRVKFGGACREIRISPEASFGELKKLMSAETGLHPLDMKVLFKDKERDNGAFLDTSGVKDRSKVVLVEDPAAKARRCLEMRRNAKMEKATKDIDRITSEVDKLTGRVTQLEGIISRGKKVADSDVLGLIEQLMDLLVRLDGIIADGEVKVRRGLQVRRIQKYVETLDMLKVKNSVISGGNVQQKQHPFPYSSQQQAAQHKPLQQPAMKWEPFDLLSAMPTPPTSAPSSSSTTTTSVPAMASAPRFNWELF